MEIKRPTPTPQITEFMKWHVIYKQSTAALSEATRKKSYTKRNHPFLNFSAFYLKPTNVRNLQSTSEYQRNSSLYNQCPIISVYAGMDVLFRELSLGFRNFFKKIRDTEFQPVLAS